MQPLKRLLMKGPSQPLERGKPGMLSTKAPTPLLSHCSQNARGGTRE